MHARNSSGDRGVQGKFFFPGETTIPFTIVKYTISTTPWVRKASQQNINNNGSRNGGVGVGRVVVGGRLPSEEDQLSG